jgi:hypothetical protein
MIRRAFLAMLGIAGTGTCAAAADAQERSFSNAQREIAVGGVEIRAACPGCQTLGRATYKDRSRWESREKLAVWIACLHCRLVFVALNFPPQ